MINLRDSEGGTALNEIATKTAQFVDIAKLLIDNGVDVNGSDELGWFYLFEAGHISAKIGLKYIFAAGKGFTVS